MRVRTGRTPPGRLFATASTEFRLAALCCQWPGDTSRVESLNILLQEDVDWARVLHLAERHRVAGLVHHALAGRTDVPPDIGAALARKAATLARGNLAAVPVLKALSAACDSAGVPFAVLKGLPLGQLAYGSLALRHSKDIDVLIAPGHLGRVEHLLADLGFQRTRLGAGLTVEQARLWRRFRKHHEFVHTQSRVRLEVHWRPFDNPRLHAPPVECAQWVDLGGGLRLPTLAPRELLLNLCVHGAGHAWFRLKWIADVAALLAQEQPGAATALLKAARARDLDRPVEQALLLSQALFPSSRREGATSFSKTGRWLANIARNALLEEDVTSPSAESDFVAPGLIRSRLLLCRGWRYRVAEVRLQATSPVDWQTVRMPVRLQFLYPLLRVPLWIRRRWLRRVRLAP